MENSSPNNNQPIKPSIEDDYEAHQNHPGPSKEAVVEEDKNGASKVLKWIIPLLVIVLLILWYFFKD